MNALVVGTCIALAVVMLPVSWVWGIRRRFPPLYALGVAAGTSALLAAMPLAATALVSITRLSEAAGQQGDAGTSRLVEQIATDPAALSAWCGINRGRCVTPRSTTTTGCLPGVHYPQGVTPPAQCTTPTVAPPATVTAASSGRSTVTFGSVPWIAIRAAIVLTVIAALIRLVVWLTRPLTARAARLWRQRAGAQSDGGDDTAVIPEVEIVPAEEGQPLPIPTPVSADQDGDGRADDRRLFSPAERAAAWVQAGMVCELCDAPTPTLDDGQGDHWWPVNPRNGELAGMTVESNRVWLCTACNGAKSNQAPDQTATDRLNAGRALHGHTLLEPPTNVTVSFPTPI